ncbi:MAG TPA: hypothetical protein VIJ86_07105 [Acidimicrobiales bacterium]
MTTARRYSRCAISTVVALVIVIGGAGVGIWVWNQSDGPKQSAATTRTLAPLSTSSTSPQSLSAPAATVADDAQYLTEIAEVDPALTSYEKTAGNVALRSLLTDGSAFCAFLQRDGDIDDAMVAVALGARNVESQTHLPLSVTTFNSVEAVALLTLCPSLQSLVPSSDMVKIRQLGASLTTATG